MSSDNTFINNVEYFFTQYGYNKTNDNNNINELRELLTYWITNKEKGDSNGTVNENVQMFLLLMNNIDIRDNPIIWSQLENC